MSGATKASRMQLHVINTWCRTCAEEQHQQISVTKYDTQHVQIALSTICNYNSARTRWSITCRSSIWCSSPDLDAHWHCMHKPAGLTPAGIVDMNTDILVSQCTTRNSWKFMHTQSGSCTHETKTRRWGYIVFTNNMRNEINSSNPCYEASHANCSNCTINHVYDQLITNPLVNHLPVKFVAFIAFVESSLTLYALACRSDTRWHRRHEHPYLRFTM